MKTISLFIVLLCFTIHLQAQEKEIDTFLLGFNTGLSFPIGGPYSDIYGIGSTVGLSFSYNFNRYIGLQSMARFATISNKDTAFEDEFWGGHPVPYTDFPSNKFLILILGPSLGRNGSKFDFNIQPQIGILKENDLTVVTQLQTIVRASTSSEPGLVMGGTIQTNVGISPKFRLGLNISYLESEYKHKSSITESVGKTPLVSISESEYIQLNIFFADLGLFFSF